MPTYQSMKHKYYLRGSCYAGIGSESLVWRERLMAVHWGSCYFIEFSCSDYVAIRNPLARHNRGTDFAKPDSAKPYSVVQESKNHTLLNQESGEPFSGIC